MSVIARIKKRREANRLVKSYLGEFARGYNGIQEKIDRKIYGFLGGISLAPSAVAGTVGLVLAAGDAKLGLSVVFAALGWSMITTMPMVVFFNGPSKKLRPLSEEIFGAAGIDVNPGFDGTLAPGRKVASFDHSFPDGRAGHVEVICDNEGYPMVLFRENAPAAVLPAPRVKELTA